MLDTGQFNKNSTNIRSRYLLQAYQAGDPVVQSVVHAHYREQNRRAESENAAPLTVCRPAADEEEEF